MHVFLVIVGILASIMLIGSVLLQSPKSGSGLTGGIASLGTVQTLGVRRTGDFLSKVTAILAAVVMVFVFSPVYPPCQGSETQTVQQRSAAECTCSAVQSIALFTRFTGNSGSSGSASQITGLHMHPWLNGRATDS